MLEIIEDGNVLSVRNAAAGSVVTQQIFCVMLFPAVIGLSYSVLCVTGLSIYIKLLVLPVLVWGLYFSVFGLAFVSRNYELRVNREGRTIAVRHKSLFKYSFRVFSFDEIATMPAVFPIEVHRVLFYEIFIMTANGEKIELCNRQKDPGQLEGVAKWLEVSLPPLLPRPSKQTGVLNLNP